ncbi:MAG: hypothetical protein EZS28_034519 [Streblomastix strix]|uniref:Uncharacterized protein n=1 Tax=Streblomastix strix TaxID=222440 RepID=A0A5J4UIE6_9EUKA|nr:MAG: hypothetical protein EZS28_034519 [Streblomastix strix]
MYSFFERILSNLHKFKKTCDRYISRPALYRCLRMLLILGFSIICAASISMRSYSLERSVTNDAKFYSEEIRISLYLIGKTTGTLINRPETISPISMIYLMTQDTSCSKIYQTGNQTNQLQVASKDFNGKCIDILMREIGQKLFSIITDHATNVDVQKSALEVSDVKIELSDETLSDNMVPICNIQEVSYHRSHSTTMDTENILSVSKNKLEASDDKFRNQLIKCTIPDVLYLVANPTGRPIHFTFA